MEGKQGAITSVVLGLFALLQVCLVAAFSQGWHPWESRPNPDTAKTAAAISQDVSPPVMAEITIAYKYRKAQVLTDIQCLSDVSSALNEEGFTITDRNEDNGYITATNKSRNIFIKCYVAQNLVAGVLYFSKREENDGKCPSNFPGPNACGSF